jgi:hypothetical protein
MFKHGITKTVISPSVGPRLGSGQVTLQDIKESKPGEMTLHDAEVVNVFNDHGIEIPIGVHVIIGMIDGHWSIFKYSETPKL